MPLVLPMIWFLLDELTEPPVYGEGRWATSPFNKFLNEYASWCISGNLVFSLVLILVFYIPLARKWQTMPEE